MAVIEPFRHNNGRIRELIEASEPELQEYIRCLEQGALIDGLTGTYRRDAFDDVFAREFDEAKRYGYELSLGMVDVDSFKSINDIHGHQTGDAALIYIARSLMSSTRKADRVGRCGGDEFQIIMPHTGAEKAYKAGEKVCKVITDGVESAGLPFLSISMGIATYPADADSIPKFVERADEALYAAKHAGKNAVFAYRMLQSR
ncbi:MAG: GGDEF domain-containing protein [Candidatus Aenigmarchaeota archaeon]|nr:GGDEF domain-containing protein [Candidatus Aenigmarchaeota archaeon]